jgi:exopolyphosphatase/pppGpp-phosphohydrolase
VAVLSKPRRTHTPTFAAVDIGANSVRLKIARLVRRRLEVIHEDREVTRLGESVFRTGALDPQAMEQTMQVLRRFHRAAQTQGADFARVVATSALRDARNAHAFVDWVRSTTGWAVEVISGLEEGRLIHLAIMSGTRVAPHRAHRLGRRELRADGFPRGSNQADVQLAFGCSTAYAGIPSP